jgi:hypothetical protein
MLIFVGRRSVVFVSFVHIGGICGLWIKKWLLGGGGGGIYGREGYAISAHANSKYIMCWGGGGKDSGGFGKWLSPFSLLIEIQETGRAIIQVFFSFI